MVAHPRRWYALTNEGSTSIAFSAFLALSLTPALCATLLKPVQAGHHVEKKGFFGKMIDSIFGTK